MKAKRTIIGNDNVFTTRTQHYDKLQILAKKKNKKVSAIVREIIDLYFALDFERVDLLIQLVNRIEKALNKLEQFSTTAEQVDRKFSSMRSAESYYFRQIDQKISALITALVELPGNDNSKIKTVDLRSLIQEIKDKDA